MSYSKYKEYSNLYNEVEEELQGYYKRKDFIVANAKYALDIDI